MRSYSAAIGSLTFMIMSPVCQTSSAVASILAPAFTYSSFEIDEPIPASCSIKTSWPWRTISITPAGVIATRYSWFLISRGTPIFMTKTFRMWPSRFARLDIRYLRNWDIDISGYRFRSGQFGMRNPLLGDVRNSQKCASLATNYLVFWQPDAIVAKYIFSGVPWRVRTT